MAREFDKLVRDAIPDVIESNGERPITHVAEDEEYRQRLREKLREEAAEFEADGTPGELADVLEVVDAIIEAEGFDSERIERLQAEKRAERGGFADGIVLERVEDGS